MSEFEATSTADEVLAGRNLQGWRILVTGVSAGLGVETARALAAHGAHVIGAVRDLAKAERATAHLRGEAAASSGRLELVRLDLASLKSVRACANALIERGEPLDAIIANAAVMAPPLSRTEDGFETQFGTNHLGHFVLINRVAALIRPSGRVVSLSSSGHRIANVDLDDPNFERTSYQPYRAYGASKTANSLFAVEFDRRHRERGVRAAAVHPGGIQTEIGRHSHAAEEQEMIARLNRQLVAQGKPLFKWKSVAQGAATSVWAAVTAPAEQIGGSYCENCHVGTIVPDGVKLGANSEGVRGYALDPARAEALWQRSEQMVSESF